MDNQEAFGRQGPKAFLFPCLQASSILAESPQPPPSPKALGLGAPVWTYKAQSNLHQPSAQDAGPALPAASSSSSKQRLTRAWQPWAVLPYLPGPTSSLPGTVPALLPASGDLCQEKGEQ